MASGRGVGEYSRVKRIYKKELDKPGGNVEGREGKSDDDSLDNHVEDVFKRHFQDTFKGLDEEKLNYDRDLLDNESEWSGFSWDNREDSWGEIHDRQQTNSRVKLKDDDCIEKVIAPTSNLSTIMTRGRDKREERMFMSCKPPELDRFRCEVEEGEGKKDQEADVKKRNKVHADENERENMVNDAALQRLLRESHLLRKEMENMGKRGESISKGNYLGLVKLTGRNRLKGMDLHARALGAKKEAFCEVNIPMAKRKGIDKKAAKRELNRRKEAREAGIILEKSAMRKKRRGRGKGMK